MTDPVPDALTERMARRAVERSVGSRQGAYAAEIRRIVDATYLLIERSGAVDPSLRDILKETGLSTQAFYRYFTSKDELFMLLLDDGRRQLLGYLEHRMAKEATPEGKLRAWIEGVLAQAANPVAAARTRPFVVHEARLVEGFPAEHQSAVALLVDQVAQVLAGVPGKTRSEVRRDAETIYELAFARLHRLLVLRVGPARADIDHLVRFATRGVGL